MATPTNVRKRKHKTIETLAEEGSPSPKAPKKLKKSKKNKKHLENGKHLEKSDIVEEKLSTEVGTEVNGEAAAEEVIHNGDFNDREQKFSKDFKMLNFRTKLRGTSFITELRHFLHLTKIRPKIVAKYIEKRGKPLEIAEALERIEKTNVLHIAYLCDALQLVLMEILADHKNHLESAVSACRYFLKSHGAVVDLLLKSSQLEHRRIALKLLTAIVCVEPQLGRQLLSSYDVLTHVKTIENLLSHSKYEIDTEESVRKCYIYFVLAYLVDGNTLLIRNILERGALIRALASGLIYDDYVTVKVVLSTLKKFVLECADISKTKKIHVFDVECCKHFARLYDWQGPAVYKAKFGGKQVQLQHHQIEAIVDAEERAAVAESAHEFLLVLLTSRKYGITFNAMKHFRQKHNTLQGRIIGSLYKPWCSELKTELVLKTLTTCPELARHTVRNFAGIVNPMRTPQQDWVKAVNFLTQIITTLHPKLLTSALEQLTFTDFSYWIKDICLPIETLVLLTGAKMLRHLKFEFRYATNRLLLAMFTQYANYMAAIIKREQSKASNAMRRFKFDMLNHLFVNFPTIEDVLYSLYMSIQAQEESGVDVLAHLEVTLDLVLITCKENRAFVNKTSTILDYLQLLRPLYAADDQQSVGENSHIKLELKAIKTILLLHPKALEPQEELFRSVLNSFIKAFVYGTQEVQRESGGLLRQIFLNTGIFDTCELEIDLWLEALRFFDAETVYVVTQMFAEVLQVTRAEVELPKCAETITNESNLRQLFENIEKGLSVQANTETVTISKLMPLIYKGVEIVAPLDEYLECVCLLMFHYYHTPEYVLKLYEMEFTSLKKYMNSWLSQQEGVSLKGELPARIPQLLPLQKLILEGNYTQFNDIFRKTSDVSFFELEIDGKLVQLHEQLGNERLVMIYVEYICFLVAQLVKQQRLQRTQTVCAAKVLTNFLNIAAKLDEQSQALDDCAEAESVLNKMLKYIYAVRISYVRSTELFSCTHESDLNYVHFLCELTELCKSYENFAEYSTNYRLKIVNSIAISLKDTEATKAQSAQLAESIRLVQAFQLTDENCTSILELLAKELRYSDFFTENEKTVYHDLLVCVLQRLAALRKAVACDRFISKLVKWYVQFIKKLGAELNLEALDEALYNFLLVSHHYITKLDSKLFSCMFAERKHTKSTNKLACLLLERDPKLHGAFVELLPEHSNKKELIYPLLKVAFSKHIEVPPALLQTIYQSYKNGFMKTIEKPQKAGVIYKENVECSVALIEHCMPKSECVDFCNKNLKFDVTELFQMKVIAAIYNKALSAELTEKQQSHIFINFISVQLQMLTVDLKRQQLDRAKIELFAYQLYTWWQQKPTTLDSTTLDYSKILNSAQWLNCCKSSLRLGMQLNEADVAAADHEHLQGLLLKLLTFLCEQMYADHTAATDADTPQEPIQLYEMICTHSKFYDILLSQRATSIKTEVLHLLLTLGKKCPAALQTAHIPVLLGAYQAKLSTADRYVLALLQLHEMYECDLTSYRPFIWGESAIAFYALQASDEERLKLTQQETSIAQVMSLIDRQVCEYTIENFPIWRQLNTLEQLPDMEFENPEQKHLQFGANRLEQRIELCPDYAFTVDELRLCPKRESVYEQCYDPAFFVPLMNMCFAPEAYAHPARPVQNGLLALTFAALSAQDKQMRLAAGSAQLRYRAHFTQSKFFERPLWLQTYDNIQSGLSELRDSWMKHKKNSGTPRVPYISALFVAKTFNLTTDPTHLLYKQLTMYLRLKSSFNFQCIPEFNVLFYSQEVEHHAFREFIVNVIRHGIKSSSDLFLLVATNTFKVLMGYYGSAMSTLDMNLLILSVFSTCAKIPASTKIMVDHVGLLPWLRTIISSLEFYHFDIIEGLISILSNLWYALRANAAEFHNYAYLCQEIHRLVLALLPHLSPRIKPASFGRLLNVCQKTVGTQYGAMSSEQLDKLISCAQKHFPEHTHEIMNIKAFGGQGAAEHAVYCQQLRQQQVDPNVVLALTSLRSYIISWWAHSNKQTTTQAIDLNDSNAST